MSKYDVELRNFGRLIDLLEHKFKSFEETTIRNQLETVKAIKLIREEIRTIKNDNTSISIRNSGRDKITAIRAIKDENHFAIKEDIRSIQSALIAIQNGDRSLGNETLHHKSDQHNKLLGALRHEIVENVTAIVGLKEAITWPGKIFQIIWTIILIVGIGFTAFFMQSGIAEYLSNPTATKVELLQQSLYEYPTIIICHQMWLDAQKAASLGFSHEAQKYGLGYYFYLLMDLDLQNTTRAKDEFFKAYKQNNFSSLEEFYTTISTDIELSDSMGDFFVNQNPAAYCPFCTSPPKKVFLYPCLCYMFNIKPKKRGIHNATSIQIKTTDRSQGLVETNPNWQIYMVNSSKRDIRYTLDSASEVSLSALTTSIIRIVPQRYLSLKTSQLCDAENYPTEKCRSECILLAAKKTYSCSFFEIDLAEHPPSDYCNVHDEKGADTFRHKKNMFISKKDSIVFSENCTNMETCKVECDRTIYELTVQFDLQYSVNDSMVLQSQNMTEVTVWFVNEAVFRDGVLTMTEVSTMSFTSLISNLGGTLGLFIGSTMMTVIQIIMFVIKYITEWSNHTK